MWRSLKILTLVIAASSPLSFAAAPLENFNWERSWLQPYEPTKVALTNDEDDKSFLDVTLSMRFPLRGFNYTWQAAADREWESEWFVAFTGRFGFYWLGGRSSEPVVGKRFNPKLAWRLTDRVETGVDSCNGNPSESDVTPRSAKVFVAAEGLGGSRCGPVTRTGYIELSYAHESNGQSISSEPEYRAAQAAALRNEEPVGYADDYLSRGWDYLGLTLKPRTCERCESADARLSYYVLLRYFLDKGILQGRKEEWSNWEDLAQQGKRRSEVNGLGLLMKYQRHTTMLPDGRPCTDCEIGDLKFVAGYETGHKNAFRHNTLRLEFGIQVSGLPVTLWWQDGYANDLARYYVKGRSYGVGIDIGSF